MSIDAKSSDGAGRSQRAKAARMLLVMSVGMALIVVGDALAELANPFNGLGGLFSAVAGWRVFFSAAMVVNIVEAWRYSQAPDSESESSGHQERKAPSMIAPILIATLGCTAFAFLTSSREMRCILIGNVGLSVRAAIAVLLGCVFVVMVLGECLESLLGNWALVWCVSFAAVGALAGAWCFRKTPTAVLPAVLLGLVGALSFASIRFWRQIASPLKRQILLGAFAVWVISSLGVRLTGAHSYGENMVLGSIGGSGMGGLIGGGLIGLFPKLSLCRRKAEKVTKI